jgi:hypothetical protein
MKPLTPEENKAILKYLCENVETQVDWDAIAKVLPSQRSSAELRDAWKAADTEIRQTLAELHSRPMEDFVLLKEVQLDQSPRRRRTRRNPRNAAKRRLTVLRFDQTVFEDLTFNRICHIMNSVRAEQEEGGGEEEEVEGKDSDETSASSHTEPIASSVESDSDYPESPKNMLENSKRSSSVNAKKPKAKAIAGAASSGPLDSLATLPTPNSSSSSTPTKTVSAFSASENSWILDKMIMNTRSEIDWEHLAMFLPNRSKDEIREHWEVVESNIRTELGTRWRVPSQHIRVLVKKTLVRDFDGKWRNFDRKLDLNRQRTTKAALRFDSQIFCELERSHILNIMNSVSKVTVVTPPVHPKRSRQSSFSGSKPNKKRRSLATAFVSPSRTHKATTKRITPGEDDDNDDESINEADHRTSLPSRKRLFSDEKGTVLL